MTTNTKIEWADHTFNPWIGCNNIGPGCDNCYAQAWDRRFAVSGHATRWGAGAGRTRTTPSYWRKPLQWEKNHNHYFGCSTCGMRWHARSESGRMQCPACGGDQFAIVRQRVFCASLADVFDNEVDPQWRADLILLIKQTPHLDWLLLTKRIGNAHAMLNEACRKVLGNSVCGWSDNPLKSGPILENVWIGATIVNQHEADRDIPKLLAVPAAKRFLSMEPLLGPVDLTALLHYPCPNLHLAVMDLETGSYECCKACDYTGIGEEIGIDWVIVGGESGPGARPMHPRWVQSLRDQCQAAGVSFFFKQWGEWQPRDHATTGADPEQEQAYLRADATEPGQLLSGDCMQFSRIGKKAAGRTLDGRTWDEVPL